MDIIWTSCKEYVKLSQESTRTWNCIEWYEISKRTEPWLKSHETKEATD